MIEKVVEGRITADKPSELLKLTTRHVKRPNKRYRPDSVE